MSKYISFLTEQTSDITELVRVLQTGKMKMCTWREIMKRCSPEFITFTYILYRASHFSEEVAKPYALTRRFRSTDFTYTVEIDHYGNSLDKMHLLYNQGSISRFSKIKPAPIVNPQRNQRMNEEYVGEEDSRNVNVINSSRPFCSIM